MDEGGKGGRSEKACAAKDEKRTGRIDLSYGKRVQEDAARWRRKRERQVVHEDRFRTHRSERMKKSLGGGGGERKRERGEVTRDGQKVRRTN